MATKYPVKLLDIIVSDDSVKANARHIVEKAISYCPSINYVKGNGHGPSSARNIALKFTSNSWVVFFDDDITIHKNYFNILCKVIEQYPYTSLIGGKNVAISKDERLKTRKNQFSNFQWLFAHTAFKGNQSRKLLYDGHSVFTSNMCVNKSVIKGKMFKETILGRKYGNIILFGEDHELCIRFQLKNLQAIFVPSLKCLHHINSTRLSLMSIYSRIFRSGIEQYLIDQQFKDNPTYQCYSYRYIRNTVSEMSASIVVGLGYEVARLLTRIGFLNKT
jgi:GT2 family glycosyltransferase